LITISQKTVIDCNSITIDDHDYPMSAFQCCKILHMSCTFNIAVFLEKIY